MSFRIPQNFIDDILGRIDIIELIDAYVPLRKKGSSYIACCPFHTEKTPSFNVSVSKQLYHCFGCGVGGNAIHFLMAHEKLEFLEALQQLAERVGLELPKGSFSDQEKPIATSLYLLLEEATNYFQYALKKQPSAIEYLKSRGVSGQTAKKFRIGYAPDEWDRLSKPFLMKYSIEDLLATGLFVRKKEGGLYDRFRDRIMFPIRDTQGRPIAFGGRSLHNVDPKYLNSPETTLFHKGNELYGLYESRLARNTIDNIWVVEGYLDVVALSQAGIGHVVATLGTAVTTSHLKRLLRFTSEMVFCFDGDKAGQQAAWRALEALLPLMQDEHQARFILLPEGEDPDSYVRRVGREGLLAMPFQTMTEYFFANMLKNIDLSLPEGKAKLAKQCSEYLQKIPGRFIRQIMLDKLSSLTRIDVSQLESLAPVKGSSNASIPLNPQPPPRSKARATRFSPMRLAIVLLLHHPYLAAEMEWPAVFDNMKVQGVSILKELYFLLKERPNMTPAMVVEHWRSRAEEEVVQKLAIQGHWVPENGVLQELRGAFAQLQARATERQVEFLLQQGQIRSLTEDEKILLQQLIKNRQSS
jgi:DNA primase